MKGSWRADAGGCYNNRHACKVPKLAENGRTQRDLRTSSHQNVIPPYMEARTVPLPRMKEFVERHASVVDEAAVVVTDGNLPPKGLREVARLCARKGVPLVFEPTSVAKCSIPFSTRVSKHSSIVHAIPCLLLKACYFRFFERHVLMALLSLAMCLVEGGYQCLLPS